MNLNALLHLTTLARIYAAIRKAVKTHHPATVRNAKGKPSITVCYLVGDAARCVLGTSSGFHFMDAKGKDITALVLRALRGGDHA